MKPTIVLPVETFSRELDSRLVWAAELSKRGFPVLVGKHSAVMRAVQNTHGTIFVGKSVIIPRFTDDVTALRILQRRNATLIHLDTEGAVFPGGEENWREILKTRIDPRVLAETDWICTWGDFQREYYLESNSKNSSRIRTTGNPRFDLYSEQYRSYFAEEVRALRSAYGDYVLFNTNFGRANPSLGLKHVFSKLLGYDASSGESREKGADIWSSQVKALADAVPLIHRAANRFPAMTFVVRPHPSEDVQAWRTVLDGIPNAVVVREGAVGPWLLGARCMIHDGCTTGVEAYLAGCPAIHFRPKDRGEGSLLPRAVSQVVHSAESLFNAIASPKTHQVDVSGMPSRLLYNLTGGAMERAINVIVEAAEEKRGRIEPFNTKEGMRRETAYALMERGKDVARLLSPERMKQVGYSRSKFPGFGAVEIERKIELSFSGVGHRTKWLQLGTDLLFFERAS